MKTYSLKTAEISRNWVIIDAAEAPLGRLATVIARRLTGKYKPTYTPHIDNGDHVVVINAANTIATGNKMADKMYHHYSGFPGGLTSKTLSTVMSEDPTKAIREAVKGMLPKNKLSPERMKRLKIYAGAEHNHDAQKPVKIGVK